MRIRKKRTIDGTDREILRILHGARRPLTGSNIAKRINYSPSAIKPRLTNLKLKGILKPVKIGGLRSFNRTFKSPKRTFTKTIKAPSSILWGLDIKKRGRR